MIPHDIFTKECGHCVWYAAQFPLAFTHSPISGLTRPFAMTGLITVCTAAATHGASPSGLRFV